MFKNLKIGAKLSVGFAVLIVTIIVISFVAILSMVDLRDTVQVSFDREFVKIIYVEDVQTNVMKISSNYYEIANETNPTVIKALVKNTADRLAANTESIKKLEASLNEGVETEKYNTFMKGREKFRETMNKLSSMIDNDQWEEYRRFLRDDFTPLFDVYFVTVKDITDFMVEDMKLIGEVIAESVGKTIMLMLVVVGIGLTVSIVLAVMISKMITKPLAVCVNVANELAIGHTDLKLQAESTDETGILTEAMSKMVAAINLMYDDTMRLAEGAVMGDIKNRADERRHSGNYQKIIKGLNDTLDAVAKPMNEAMAVMEKLANKDMTSRVKGEYKGAFDQFKENINLAANNLDDALMQVDMAVEQITAASREISSGSQVLAEATSEQASSLEEISSSLEEINSLTGNNADNAKSGLKLADSAVLAVDEGNSAMEKMNQAMASILNSSQETGKIIKTIDEIAFQTNLLALNAAVEAAHAGDAGKGFAVVAEEVKNLALRSAEAAKNTNVLIEESGQNSEMGSRIVEQVTKSFQDMKEQFNKVKSIVTEISASSDEQAHGVNQISTGVGEMNRVTQQNAANAEESASAAEQLTSQANELKGMVNTFNLSKKTAESTTSYSKPKQQATSQADKRAPMKQLGHKKPAGYEMKPENVLPLDSMDEDDFADF